MAEINIQWVETRRAMIGADYGARPGSYVYQLRYDMPDLPEMDNHVHTIPIEAVAHLLIESDSDDAVSAADFFVREAATSVAQAVAQRSGTGLLDAGDPREAVARLRATQRRALDATVEAAATDPATLEETGPLLRRYATAQDASEEAAVAFLDRSMSKPTAVPVPEPARKHLELRRKTAAQLLPVPDTHFINRSAQGWQDMIGLLGEHKGEIRRSQIKSFDARYRDRIMQITQQKSRGSR